MKNSKTMQKKDVLEILHSIRCFVKCQDGMQIGCQREIIEHIEWELSKIEGVKNV